MSTQVIFAGIDSLNRPVFKDDNGEHYGACDKLHDWNATESNVLDGMHTGPKVEASDLTYFGCRFDCEPMGTPCDVEIVRQEQAVAKRYHVWIHIEAEVDDAFTDVDLPAKLASFDTLDSATDYVANIQGQSEQAECSDDPETPY